VVLAIEGFACLLGRNWKGTTRSKEWNEGYGKPRLLLPENSKWSANREPNVPVL